MENEIRTIKEQMSYEDVPEDRTLPEGVYGGKMTYCYDCGIMLRCLKNGVTIIGTSGYRRAMTDVYQCEKCGNRIMVSGEPWDHFPDRESE